MRSTIITIFVIALGGVAIWLFLAAEEHEVPVVENGAEEPAHSDWQTGEHGAIEFRYPRDATITRENERAKVTYVGPESHMSEITDGFTVFIDSYDDQVVSAQQIADDEFQEQTEILTAIEPVTQADVGGRPGYYFVIEGGLGTPTEYYVWEMDGQVILVQQAILDPEDRGYRVVVTDIRESISVTQRAADEQSTMEITLALLSHADDVEPTHGCDTLATTTRMVPRTATPLATALRELFLLSEDTVNGYQNFMARTNETLQFDEVRLEEGTAHVYLTGEVSGMVGVCDHPRANMQITETARQFSTVDDVVIYRNGEEDDLIPDMR